MIRFRALLFLLPFFLFLPISQARAAKEITIDKMKVQEISPDRYEVSATVYNHTNMAREVVLRAQLFFYEEASPEGDIPAMILRKDETVIMRKREGRTVKIKLLNEGTLPKTRLRLVPELRLRRQREWNY